MRDIKPSTCRVKRVTRLEKRMKKHNLHLKDNIRDFLPIKKCELMLTCSDLDLKKIIDHYNNEKYSVSKNSRSY